MTHGQGLDLVVFHPDSDMGFSDRAHPMLSRTLINQVSAMNLPDIQTPALKRPLQIEDEPANSSNGWDKEES